MRHPILPPKPTLRHLTATAALLCSAVALPAHAIVSTTDASNWLGSSQSLLDGEAKLVINGNTGCSGTLLDGGAYLLTAAHCVANSSGTVTANSISVSFMGGTVTASVSNASQITVYSSWNGVLGENDDLALVKLDTAVTAVSGYALYTGDALGQVVVLAGYGLTGTGSTGTVSGTFGTLHYGFNQYDTTFASASGSVLYDFDNGTQANNVIGSTGLGTAEALIASGDSGGGSFVYSNGMLYLVGVHSFVATVTGYDIDNKLDSSFGELGGDTTLSSATTLAWLEQVSTVPEPATLAQMLAGLVALACGWRRQRRSAQASPAQA